MTATELDQAACDRLLAAEFEGLREECHHISLMWVGGKPTVASDYDPPWRFDDLEWSDNWPDEVDSCNCHETGRSDVPQVTLEGLLEAMAEAGWSYFQSSVVPTVDGEDRWQCTWGYPEDHERVSSSLKAQPLGLAPELHLLAASRAAVAALNLEAQEGAGIVERLLKDAAGCEGLLSSNEDGVDLVELESELWRESVRRHLNEMLVREDGNRRYIAGPFRDGWTVAIEEIAHRLGIEIDQELL